MCGITGIISKDSVSETDRQTVRKMTAKLIHRGPNSVGYFDDGHISAGMRRLSIIDISHGDQPLYNEDGTIVLIANGEIYNFVELKSELEKLGHKFTTKSDCETIIHAYEEYGENFINHLRGMFAFCLRDKKNDLVIIARDRLGEKPLYIYESGKQITFSSELKSIVENIPTEKMMVDNQSLYLLFHYGYVPEPRCIMKDVRKLPAGHLISINTKTGVSSERKYWDIEKTRKIDTKNLHPEDEVRRHLDEVEKIIIRSDVPVGISLSGGLDSSIIATLAAKYSNSPLHAFSVGYPGYPENDERNMAKSLAKDLGLIFHEIEINEKDFLSDLNDMVYFMDEPLADIAAYGYYAVSKKAREKNVPVVLSGFGGDELFWGYEWVRRAAKLNSLKMKVLGRIQLPFMLISEYWRDILRNPNAVLGMLKNMVFSKKLIVNELTPLWRYMKRYGDNLFTKEFIKIADESMSRMIEYSSIDNHPGLAITSVLCKTWLVSNCLNLGDRMSMAHAVEMRLPLLDYKFVENAMQIKNKYPYDYHEKYKHWLIKATEDLIPKDIVKRKKRGFTPPTNMWVEHAVKAHENLLVDGYLVRNNIVKEDFIKKAILEQDRNGKFLYISLIFEIWAKMYIPKKI